MSKKFILFAVAVLAVVSAVAVLRSTPTAEAVTPAQFGLQEGNTITAYQQGNDPDIYIINQPGYKRLFTTPKMFEIYGHLGWSKVKQVSNSTRDAFEYSPYFRVANTAAVYCVDIKSEDVATLHPVIMTAADALAQDPNFAQKIFTINQAEFALYPIDSAVTSLSQCPTYNRFNMTPTPTPMGNVSVSLASDNPAAGTLVKSSAINDLLHLQFSGSGKVTSVVLKRIGVSADTDMTNVYLYDGARRLTDAATVANGMISFNDTAGIFTVAGSKNISVRADIGSSTGITLGVQLVSFNGNSTNISGNLFTVADGTLAGVSLTDNTDPAVNAALDPANDVTVWRETVAVTTRYVWMKSLQLRVLGSAGQADVQNFRLYLSGSQIGTAVSQRDANGYIVFDFTGAPIKLDTGNRELKVLADVIGGSSLNFTVSFRQYVDFQVTDSQYNSNVVVTSTGSFPTDGGQQTIASGTLLVTKTSDSPAGDVIKGAAGIVFARYEFKATGEKMKVENLRAYFDESDNTVSELRNGAIFANDGMGGGMVQIGSTQDILETANGVGYTQYSLGSSLIVEPGHPRIIEIRADVADGDSSDNMDSGETITAGFKVGATNVQRMVTLDYVNSTARDGNQVTVKTGTFTAGKYSGFANQNVVSPSTNVKIGHFTLTAASAENIGVNTINLDSDAGGTFLASDVTNMYLKVWNDTGSLVTTTSSKATVSTTASNSYSVNFTIPVNKTYQVEVYGDVASGETPGQSMNLELDAAGVNSASGTSATTGEADGQTVTVQSSSLSVNNGSIAAATLAKSGDVKPAYQFTLTPTYDDYYLDEVYVDLPNTTASTTGAIAFLSLKEGSTVIGTATVNTTTGSASFTGLGRLLTQAAGTKTYNVDVTLSNVGPGANDTAGTVKIRLDGMKYRPASTGVPVTTNGMSTTTYTGNNIILHKTYPMVANQALPNSTLFAGTQTLFKTKISAVGGNASLGRIVFSVTRTNGPTVTETSLKVYEDNVDITSLGTLATASNDLDVAGANTAQESFVFTNERVIDGTGHVYELRGTVGGTVTSGHSITTTLLSNASSSSGGGTYTNVATTVNSSTPSLVWSDMSAVSHATTTPDWMNEYLVQGINIAETLYAP